MFLMITTDEPVFEDTNESIEIAFDDPNYLEKLAIYADVLQKSQKLEGDK